MMFFRSFSISIFEIYSEGGKGEKVFDLSPDGTELSMQQSSIKGLQEVYTYFCCTVMMDNSVGCMSMVGIKLLI